MIRRPILHPATWARLDAMTTGTAASYIFHGPKGSGKRLAAEWVAMRLNCAGDGGDDCATCRQMKAGNYPDLIIIQPEDKPSVTIEQIRRLLQALTLAPYQPHQTRVVIIDSAESLTPEAQNALLKSLEEPPLKTRFILITDTIEALLPTVRSRLAAQYFAPVPEAAIAAELEQLQHLKPVQAARLAALADGVVGRAIELATSPEAAAHRTELDAAVTRLLSGNVFSRLSTVRALIDAKQPVPELITALHRNVVQAFTTPDVGADGTSVSAASGRLQALSSARRLLAAGVVPRVVLDRLALELA